MQIGYDMDDYNNYYSHELAFSGEEYNMVCESNIDVPGRFIFNIGEIILYAKLF